MMENKLDGNVIGGILQTIFPAEMTIAQATCTGCGTANAIGDLAVYTHRMGIIVRCPSCDLALIRILQRNKYYCLDMQAVLSELRK